jgi:hypothetical protein
MVVEVAPRTAPAAMPKPGEVRIVEVPERRVFLIEGCGNFGSAAFQGALETLFSVAYALQVSVLRPRGIEGQMGLLEGLYELEALDPDRDGVPWTLMLELPADATPDDVESAIAIVRRRGHHEGLDRLRHETFREGLAGETLHVGPYDAEGPTIARLEDAIRARGYRPHGRHHEIYVADPRRAPPDRLRTLIRQPIF